MQRAAFRAMGTDVEVLLDVPAGRASTAGAFAQVQAEFDRLEAIFSRFQSESELSALNRAGRTTRASADLLAVTTLALDARERTGGRFDPTVHDALVAAGYDRTFEEIAAKGNAVVTCDAVACLGSVEVDSANGEITLGPGVRLDFGGVAKGYAVDRACDLLEPFGPCLVSAGGDLAARGFAWPVGVETHLGAITLELTNRALATSGSDRRRWATPDGDAHHLIDPRTGMPAVSDLLRVTAVGTTTVDAEVLAKALYLAGVERATLEADELGVPAVLTRLDGISTLVGGLA